MQTTLTDIHNLAEKAHDIAFDVSRELYRLARRLRRGKPVKATHLAALAAAADKAGEAEALSGSHI